MILSPCHRRESPVTVCMCQPVTDVGSCCPCDKVSESLLSFVTSVRQCLYITGTGSPWR